MVRNLKSKLLEKQLSNSKISHLLEDEGLLNFLDTIDETYFEYDQQIDRTNKSLDEVLNRTMISKKRMKESSEEIFKKLVEGFPGIISWFDRDLNYIGGNKNFFNFTKMQPNQVLGLKLGCFNSAIESKFTHAIYHFSQSQDEYFKGRFTIHLNGEEFFLSSHFQKLDEGNLIVVMSIDMSQEFKMQIEIDKQIELSIKNAKLASLGEMAASVAHEINNPLMVISGYSKHLLQLYNNDEDLKSYEGHLDIYRKVEKIVKMSDRISRIIKGMKYVSRDGDQDPFETVTFETLFSNVADLCTERLSFSGIELRIEGNIQSTIHIQQSLTSQVFLNLINNSIDAILTSEGKKWIEINIINKENLVEFKITDSGTGVPIEVEDKIFLPFFTTKEIGKGTGLGLSICKTIIEKQKGRIYLSRKSVGTEFILELPCGEQDEDLLIAG